MQDLKDVTNNVHYENFRCKKLAGVVGPMANDPKVVTNAPSRSVLHQVLLNNNFVTIETLWLNLRWRKGNTR